MNSVKPRYPCGRDKSFRVSASDSCPKFMLKKLKIKQEAASKEGQDLQDYKKAYMVCQNCIFWGGPVEEIKEPVKPTEPTEPTEELTPPIPEDTAFTIRRFKNRFILLDPAVETASINIKVDPDLFEEMLDAFTWMKYWMTRVKVNSLKGVDGKQRVVTILEEDLESAISLLRCLSQIYKEDTKNDSKNS